MKNSKGFTLIELMIVVAILAILSVVAVPAFIKYMRKAKTSEAIEMLAGIYKGAAEYYSAPRSEEGTGDKVACQFVNGDTGVTPTEGTCCSSGVGGGPDADADDRCDVTPGYWDTAIWSALKFQMSDQHYFIYQYVSNDLTLADAEFTTTAFADLDCDGIQSTFERYGHGDANATYGECSMESAPAIFSNNETE